jgi:large subunit ribosomal protein L15
MRIGRGGKRGKTSGRGGKGQTARAGSKMRPEMRDIIKKIPKRRGYGKNRSRTVRRDRTPFFPINLAQLETVFLKGGAISPKILLEKGFIVRTGGKLPKVKILGNETNKKFSLSECAVSASAKKAIEAAGGKVE